MFVTKVFDDINGFLAKFLILSKNHVFIYKDSGKLFIKILNFHASFIFFRQFSSAWGIFRRSIFYLISINHKITKREFYSSHRNY